MREQKTKQSYSKREQGSIQPTHARLDATKLAVLDVRGLGVSFAKNSGCVQYVIRPRVANTRRKHMSDCAPAKPPKSKFVAKKVNLQKQPFCDKLQHASQCLCQPFSTSPFSSLSNSHVIIIGAMCNEGSLSFLFFDSLKHHCRYCKLERVCHAADHVDISCNGQHAIWVGLTLCVSCQIGWLWWGRRHPPFLFLPIPSLLSCPQPPSLVFPQCCFLSCQCKWVATCSLKSTLRRFSSMGQNITIKNTLLFTTTRTIDWLWVYQLVVNWSENFIFLD